MSVLIDDDDVNDDWNWELRLSSISVAIDDPDDWPLYIAKYI